MTTAVRLQGLTDGLVTGDPLRVFLWRAADHQARAEPLRLTSEWAEESAMARTYRITSLVLACYTLGIKRDTREWDEAVRWIADHCTEAATRKRVRV